MGHLRNAAALVGEGKKGGVLEGVLPLVPLYPTLPSPRGLSFFFHSSFKEGAKVGRGPLEKALEATTTDLDQSGPPSSFYYGGEGRGGR